jgi:hypothetical protein
LRVGLVTFYDLLVFLYKNVCINLRRTVSYNRNLATLQIRIDLYENRNVIATTLVLKRLLRFVDIETLVTFR